VLIFADDSAEFLVQKM